MATDNRAFLDRPKRVLQLQLVEFIQVCPSAQFPTPTHRLHSVHVLEDVLHSDERLQSRKAAQVHPGLAVRFPLQRLLPDGDRRERAQVGEDRALEVGQRRVADRQRLQPPAFYVSGSDRNRTGDGQVFDGGEAAISDGDRLQRVAATQFERLAQGKAVALNRQRLQRLAV